MRHDGNGRQEHAPEVKARVSTEREEDEDKQFDRIVQTDGEQDGHCDVDVDSLSKSMPETVWRTREPTTHHDKYNQEQVESPLLRSCNRITIAIGGFLTI